MSLARRFVDGNVRASRALSAFLRLPTDKSLWQRFEQDVQNQIRALPDGAVVVDVGGGRRCVYHHALRPEIELVATDVSAEELALNPHASRAVVADISTELPLPSASADLLVSRAVLEHVSDVKAAVRHMAVVLKPNAQTIHLLPGRYSLFGLAARGLPFKPLLAILHLVNPSTIDQVEFDVFYDHGTPKQLAQAFQDAGFRDVRVVMTWASPEYFESFFPAFLLYTLYEIVVRRLRVMPVASYLVVYARR